MVLTHKPDLGNASVGSILEPAFHCSLLYLGKEFYFLRKELFIIPEANLSLKILPVVPEEMLYPVVDQVIAMIRDSGLKYWVGPNDTTIEGDLDNLLALVKKAQEICIRAGAPRVISMISIDYKPAGVTIDEKISKYHS